MSFFPPLCIYAEVSHISQQLTQGSQVLKRQAKSHSSGENSTSMKFYDQIIAQLGLLRKLLALHTHGSSARWKERVIPIHSKLI